MAGKLSGRPGRAAALRRFHEGAAIVTVGLIAAHGGLLLFDSYLRPGLLGITVPFAMSYRPVATGLGIIGGWLTAMFAVSFYLRRRIGARLWRKMHRFTPIAYVLALFHVLAAGTDAASPWMLATLTGLTLPVAFALSYRLLGAVAPRRGELPRRGGSRSPLTVSPARALP
jgi:sulfoxide reductase heme-binding subunit YedZ